MRQQCDDCHKADKTLCAECNNRRAMAADRAYDELRESGFYSEYQRNIVSEMEEQALRPFGRL